MSKPNPHLDTREQNALNYFSALAGRTWKAQLRNSWMTGVYKYGDESILQYLRNASYFGPRGLETYQPYEKAEAPS